MKVMNYIERNHEKWGVALFVIPACALGLGFFELIVLMNALLN